jgi:capsid protein
MAAVPVVADGELNPWRDRIVSRVRDLVRNDGWAPAASRASSTMRSARASARSPSPTIAPSPPIPASRLSMRPGPTSSAASSRYWRTWAFDTGRYCDSQRRLTMPQMMRLGFRHKLVDGDALALLRWMPERIGLGRARFATAVQLIDPDRLSNPQQQFDQQSMRGGVEVDDEDVADRLLDPPAHQGDWFSAGGEHDLGPHPARDAVGPPDHRA